MKHPELDFLAELENVINDRLTSGRTESYTAALVASGEKRVAQKVGEEAVELALAAVAGSADELVDETADLLFHVLVLLGSKGIRLETIVQRLKTRHTNS